VGGSDYQRQPAASSRALMRKDASMSSARLAGAFSSSVAIVPMLATGILLAFGTMFPRMLLIAVALNMRLFRPLLVPALFYWWSQRHTKSDMAATISNLLEIRTALSFGALLAPVMFLGKALQAWLGEDGIMMLAFASGLSDVDAITLSLARKSQDELATRVAVTGIVIAAGVNSLVKGGMATVIGGRHIGMRVGIPLLTSAVVGLSTNWSLNW
jgi:uncharacterized membrane protein (DUF4010 family)